MHKGSPFTCPACGGEVPPGAAACPHCGSDERTGWSERACLDGLDIYTEEDYQETIDREFGGEDKPGLKRSLTWLVALLMLLLMLKVFVFRC
ncbi:zinc ribbon domain-containing protein [bacterium]|nr:zinc ribbon domain-containing protein [bacterium]